MGAIFLLKLNFLGEQMRKIYTFEAVLFGFKVFFKKPLFFLLAFIVSKIMWLLGLGLSFLIALPYFIHLIEFVLKLFARVKDLIFNYIFHNGRI